jgi:large subunit ribosomal protein L25
MEDYRLVAERRSSTGKKDTKQLRAAGRVPANLYGFKKDGMSLSVAADDVNKVVAGGSKVVDVEVDGSVDKAVVQELQWDTFSTYVQHVDLMRVDPEGMATVEVPLAFVGEPPALKVGGQLRYAAKRVTITCSDYRVPQNIVVRIGSMQLGDTVRVSDLPIPEGMKTENAADEAVVELYDPRKAE